MKRRTWTAAELRRVVAALRAGGRWEDVVAATGRTKGAVGDALRNAGYSPRALRREARLVRVAAILAQGGGLAEVMAAEGLKRRTADTWITMAQQAEDRRKKAIASGDRAVYQAVRDHGFKGAARLLGRPISTVRRIANRYREQELPTSPPLGKPRGARRP